MGITEDKMVLIFVNFVLDQNLIQLLTFVPFNTHSVETIIPNQGSNFLDLPKVYPSMYGCCYAKLKFLTDIYDTHNSIKLTCLWPSVIQGS